MIVGRRDGDRVYLGIGLIVKRSGVGGFRVFGEGEFGVDIEGSGRSGIDMGGGWVSSQIEGRWGDDGGGE